MDLIDNRKDKEELARQYKKEEKENRKTTKDSIDLLIKGILEQQDLLSIKFNSILHNNNLTPIKLLEIYDTSYEYYRIQQDIIGRT